MDTATPTRALIPAVPADADTVPIPVVSPPSIWDVIAPARPTQPVPVYPVGHHPPRRPYLILGSGHVMFENTVIGRVGLHLEESWDSQGSRIYERSIREGYTSGGDGSTLLPESGLYGPPPSGRLVEGVPAIGSPMPGSGSGSGSGKTDPSLVALLVASRAIRVLSAADPDDVA